MNPRHLVLGGLALAALALVACPRTNAPQPSPPSPAPASGYLAPPPPPSGAVAGAACDTAAECASGVCEGIGCGAQQGYCAAASRACTKDLREYCGCDGKTFYNSGSCPGARFAHPGACEIAAPPPPPSCPGGAGCPTQADGQACLAATDCASGVCEGLGCGAATPGVCVPAKRSCTRDKRAFCGCDGATFYGSGSCPGQRFAARAACPNG